MIYNGSDKHKIALFENKQDKLTAGDNITLTPQLDGTVKISASGGVANLDDLGDVDAASPENGQALVYDEERLKWVPGEAGQVDDVQMNGQSIVHNKVASFNNYVELTQAQYDALPASKLTDGILYCIKDSGIVEGDKYAPIIYSLEEREVGVWTDGKPLYEITIHINALPSTTYTLVRYPHGIVNVDKICDYQAIARWTTGETSHLDHLALPTTSSSDIARSSIETTVDTTNIYIRCGYDRSSLSADYTIRYTKTTDVPGSGTWGTDGVPMAHYDGTERIIGTWFGETLYQKTINVPSLPNYNTLQISTPSNIKEVINFSGYAYRTSTGSFRPLPFAAGGTNDIRLDLENYVLRVVTYADWTSYGAYITVQYTKTT